MASEVLEEEEYHYQNTSEEALKMKDYVKFKMGCCGTDIRPMKKGG